MLPAHLRMRRPADFAATIRGGSRAGRTTVVVHLRPTTDDGAQHVGFVVARSVGGAVVRNRVRRRLRNVVVEQHDTWPTGVDVVVRALPPAAEATYADLARDFSSAFSAAGRRAKARAVGL
ncbi:ribonuclease P protein component [Actinotalea sp. K2]|uniref:ribonuclease P protein component n=1 Tax=Actinotalea sp. K2 TaxID=2939438 RepID=UPI0020181341|nr:ribonuclease P protein component [Actinotalea sp. K2]MCL3860756.1 ribonuclease P protein component [Actinotalea sp. K2]